MFFFANIKKYSVNNWQHIKYKNNKITQEKQRLDCSQERRGKINISILFYECSDSSGDLKRTRWRIVDVAFFDEWIILFAGVFDNKAVAVDIVSSDRCLYDSSSSLWRNLNKLFQK